MAKRKTNWVAWGLSAILTVVVLLGGEVLVADYHNRLPERRRRVLLLPIGEWGFGRQRMYWVSLTTKAITEVYKCGFLQVWLAQRHAAGAKASIRSSRG
jgi:hypothetical protein